MAIRVPNESPSAAQAAAEAARRAAAEAARRAAEEAARRAVEEAARRAAEAASSSRGSDTFTSTSTPQGLNLSGDTAPAEGSSLLTENTGDGEGGGLPEPQWLEQGNRPPWFDAAEWNDRVPGDQAAILDKIRADWASHVEAMEPPWMRDGTAPPPMSEDWDQLSPAEQQEMALAQWDATVQEEMAFYFGEIPEGGLPVQEPLLVSTNGAPWGQGMSGEWATYHQEGQDPIAQFLNTGVILGGEGQDYTHGNLCGELSVMSVVGLGIAEGLQSFNELGFTSQNGTAILSDGEALTSSTHLEEFFRQNGWQIVGEDGDGSDPAMQDLNGGHSAANTYNNNHAREPTAEEVQRLLADGGALTVLVNIDGAQDGMLASAGDSTDDITHWVSVLSVSENAQGETYVRVYNPYQNREEVYSWEEFQAAWNTPSPSEQGYTYVAARPPETSTDAP